MKGMCPPLSHFKVLFGCSSPFPTNDWIKLSERYFFPKSVCIPLPLSVIETRLQTSPCTGQGEQHGPQTVQGYVYIVNDSVERGMLIRHIGVHLCHHNFHLFLCMVNFLDMYIQKRRGEIVLGLSFMHFLDQIFQLNSI